MSLPTLITVIGKLLRADGTPSKGFVYFYSDISVLYSGDESVMIPSYVRAVVDPLTGEFTCEVPASDDPAWTPEGWTWRVVVNTPTFKDDFLTVVPYDAPGGEIDFSTLVPATDGGSSLYAAYNHTHPGGSGVTSVNGETGIVVLDKADIGLGNVDNTSDSSKPVSTATQTALNGKANTSHTHSISDVNDLQTQLEGLQPAGDYLTADDISNLISDETFNEGMATKLDNTNGVTALYRRSSPGAPTTGSWTLGTLVLDSLGVLWYCTSSGTPGTWTTKMEAAVVASDHNLAGWTFDPVAIQGSLAQITAGLSYVARIKCFSSSITNIHMHLTAGGGSLTSGQCFASVHNDAGTQLGISGSLHSTGAGGWGDGGYKTIPMIGAPIPVTPGSWIKLRWWWNGSTGPVISRGINSSGVITGAGLVNPNFRFATADSGLTTTGPTTIGTMTASPTAYWCAVS